MRSIRRSMTVYLFALLAITLAVVWVVIDQVTARALAAREAAGADLIRARYEERVREEKLRTDKALLDQARLLGNIMGQRYVTRFNEELTKYRIHMTAAPLMFVNNPLAESAWTMSFDHPGVYGKPNPGPGLLFRMYFANLPIPDDYVAHFDDEGHGNDYFQINTVAGREWRSRSLGAHKLPFDHKEIDKTVDPTKPDEPTNTIDWVYGEATINGERVRKVLYKMPHYNGNVQFGRGPRPGGPGGPWRLDVVGAEWVWRSSTCWFWCGSSTTDGHTPKPESRFTPSSLRAMCPLTSRNRCGPCAVRSRTR
jgi:hypothetical protein